jgi:hypothetical protein
VVFLERLADSFYSVSIQRSLYKRLRDGTDESSTLTEDRIQKLDDIGFEWTSADHRSIPWELRYQELVEFVVSLRVLRFARTSTEINFF